MISGCASANLGANKLGNNCDVQIPFALLQGFDAAPAVFNTFFIVGKRVGVKQPHAGQVYAVVP